jgi:alkylhydroperoxidase family enzyme
MPRITPVEANSPPDDGSLYEVVGQINAHRPAIAAALGAVHDTLHASGTLSPRLRELVRLRIAYHNQCRQCMASRYEPDHVTESLVCSLETPEVAGDLTDAERLALRYSDLFATDHLALDDAVHEQLKAEFDDGEIVELGMTCAFYVGFGRLTATWGVDDGLPPSFRVESDKRLTPWGHADAVTIT